MKHQYTDHLARFKVHCSSGFVLAEPTFYHPPRDLVAEEKRRFAKLSAWYDRACGICGKRGHTRRNCPYSHRMARP